MLRFVPVLLALALLAGRAHGQDAAAERTSSLSWVRLPGAERCATAPELARAVESRLAREVFVAPRHADLSVEGRVTPRDGGGYTATFAVATADGTVLGERTLDSADPDCHALTETVAFVVAVLIDPDAEAGADLDSGSDSGSGDSDSGDSDADTDSDSGDSDSGDSDADADSDSGDSDAGDSDAGDSDTGSLELDSQTETRSPAWSVEVDLGLGVGLGLLPSPAVGGFGAVVLETPWWVAFELTGSLYPYAPQSTTGGDANWLAAFGGLLVCTARFEVGRFGVRACAGGELGFEHIHGAVDPTQTHVAGHVLVRARLTYRVFKGLVVWTRPTLSINPRSDPYMAGAATLHEPEIVAGIFDLGIGYVFD